MVWQLVWGKQGRYFFVTTPLEVVRLILNPHEVSSHYLTLT